MKPICIPICFVFTTRISYIFVIIIVNTQIIKINITSNLETRQYGEEH